MIDRANEVRATFLKPGEHTYTARLHVKGAAAFQGTVIVTPARGEPVLPLTCGQESSDEICIAP